ncbi:MAG: hypothetical protein ACXADW_19415 [Candidatus Hodarchaeales archaeon]|jgi:hypothetical protein
MIHPLLVIVILFVMSISAAYVLFKLLENTAVVKLPFGQFGGAIAGFIGVFLILYNSYQSLSESPVNTDLESAFNPSIGASWIPVNVNSGLPEKIKIIFLDTTFYRKDPETFKSVPLKLKKLNENNKVIVSLEKEEDYFLGELEESDFENADLFSRMELQIKDFRVQKIEFDSSFSKPDLYPFSISLNSASISYTIINSENGEELKYRPANKGEVIVLPYKDIFYIISLVTSAIEAKPPFAEFAIGELTPNWDF